MHATPDNMASQSLPIAYLPASGSCDLFDVIRYGQAVSSESRKRDKNCALADTCAFTGLISAYNGAEIPRRTGSARYPCGCRFTEREVCRRLERRQRRRILAPPTTPSNHYFGSEPTRTELAKPYPIMPC